MTGQTVNSAGETRAKQPLSGLKVIDASTIIGGPLAAMILGDFGADVLKIEHPSGDSVRSQGRSKDGVPLWWKMIARNKRAITLNFGRPEGQELLLDLLRDTDLLIENFRPGTLERWNLGWERLHAHNPSLVLLRVTGFGQFGPYASRPGFGTLAESMSGFAHVTGQPDGPPTLPPLGLADGIAGITGAAAAMMALYHRDVNGDRGQMIDLAIIEPILTVLGPQPIEYDQLAVIASRIGNRSPTNAPRNTYRTSDGRWVAVSTSAQSIAERVMRLVGNPEVIQEPWFRSGAERAAHSAEVDAIVGGWIAERPFDVVIAAFQAADAAVAPIYDIADVMRDPQFQALNSIVSVPDDDLGGVRMQNVLFRMSETPGAIRWAGRRLGQDNEAVYGALGVTPERLAELRRGGIV